MPRLSTFAVSTLVPALKVLSTTLPVSTFFSVVRTNAPPLPGLTCWKAVTDHSWPSRLSTRPFFRSFVVATGDLLVVKCGSGADTAGGTAVGAAQPDRAPRGCPPGYRSHLEQLPRGAREQLRPAVADDQRVLDADPAP